jgi:hypothetical protein
MKARRIIILILVVFAIYAVITNPNRAADVVSSGWDIVWQGVVAITRFFDALISQ